MMAANSTFILVLHHSMWRVKALLFGLHPLQKWIMPGHYFHGPLSEAQTAQFKGANQA